MNENVNFICNFIGEGEMKKKKGTGGYLMSINSILNIRYGLLVKLNIHLHFQISF